MAVKASATITLTQYRDTQSVTRYYKLQTAGSSAPLKPTTKPPSSDWTDSEPACDISKELYFCDLTIFSNGEGEYSKVSKSSSYEAAKEAYHKAQGAQATADEAQDNALSAQENADALDVDLNDFKSNEYSQINNKVGELVEYKGENEKEIGKIREELSQELVAQKFARIEPDKGSLILGEINGTTAVLTNEQFGFYTPNSEIAAAYFGKDNDAWAFNIERGIIKNDLRFSGFQWIARSNKNMSLKWIK